MITCKDPKYHEQIKCIYSNNQEHIFKFWHELDDSQKTNLLNSVSEIDCGLLKELVDLGLGRSRPVTELFKLEPVEIMTLEKRKESDGNILSIGEKALRDGKAAVFLVAGGQATRLGITIPKGLLPITPLKNKSLFLLHAEKIQAASKKYNTVIPWYIMTNRLNYSATKAFFEENNFFGLSEKNIMLFKQDMLPAIDHSGKILLSTKDSISLSPNGHGGSVKALHESGALDDMLRRNIKYMFYFQVDNVLTKICDPYYLGYHISNGAEISNKVVRKNTPEDKVGIICSINGRDGVVEYSDLSKEDMYARTDDNELKYWAGSIALHIMNVDFIKRQERSSLSLPYHLAVKDITCIDSDGNQVKNPKKNGIKFEMFVFDLLLNAKKSFTMEVDRMKEFSAVKNKAGSESPETARLDLLRNYAELLKEAGLPVPVNQDGVPEHLIEISPLFALDKNDILKKKKDIPALDKDLYLQ